LVVGDVAALVAGADAEGLELSAGTAAPFFSESSPAVSVLDSWASAVCDCGTAACAPGEDADVAEAAEG